MPTEGLGTGEHKPRFGPRCWSHATVVSKINIATNSSTSVRKVQFNVSIEQSCRHTQFFGWKCWFPAIPTTKLRLPAFHSSGRVLGSDLVPCDMSTPLFQLLQQTQLEKSTTGYTPASPSAQCPLPEDALLPHKGCVRYMQ